MTQNLESAEALEAEALETASRGLVPRHPTLALT
jgi:hypothetical protein